ncbi:RND family transporter [Sinimarinibacterium sp. NLF-5-8]|uniref:efflux RND transporter permease subunit n=1 Tax=Sinimarinibacterium sp. NLF-5-8 TaxID=2698684 RepID=UPI00137BB119|nr:MMPL family transporter [Sinimarinibacterium sp. NLF-5-8]QHS11110.1 MMPL family transporter [Sinimarinibacterium sp. NLF-5-8]
MYALRLRFAQQVLRHRALSYAVFGFITLFFMAGLPRVELKTVFSDLLPSDDPFVQVFEDHPGFGNPLTVMVMIRRSDGGTIYAADTLAKVWNLTRAIDLAPGVDHDQVLSIATEKARYSEATPFGIDMRPLMGNQPPSDPDDLLAFKAKVEQAPKVREFLISRDDRATLVMATFIEDKVDYGEAFTFIQQLADNTRDAHHEVFVAGQPTLIGWVYQYQQQMLMIFGLTLAALIAALVLYMRNRVGVIVPVATSSVAAIWAFGLVGWLNIPIEPLLMVVPLLLTARSFSHSVQFTERFYEIYAEIGDRGLAAEKTMTMMAAPSLLGIMTDVLGIVAVCAAPIPAMIRHAIFCGMWAIWLIPTGIVLISLLLASLPPPHNARQLSGKSQSGMTRVLRKVLLRIAHLTHGRWAMATTVVVILLSILTVHTASQIKIGNPVEGSNLLWDDSAFNTAIRAINDAFPGVNTLEIVLEARDPHSDEWNAQRLGTTQTLLRLQKLMEQSDAPPRATLSFADYLQESSRLFNGGHPAWLPLDPRQQAVSAAAVGTLMGASAKNYRHVVDDRLQHATVSLWYPDNKQDTVDAALAAARQAVADVGEEHEHFRVRLGTGTIALQEAVNRVIKRYHRVVILLVNVCVFVLVSIAYRSAVAGLILLIPVNLANEALTATMHLLGVGLDVNSMIVAAIGVGVGIDYGIYLLSRICEELQSSHGEANWGMAIDAALQTTGKAILFTATIMAVGIFPWYVLSDLKFIADMGLLLMAIMGINMLLSLIVLPLLVGWIKPRFALEPAHGSSAIGIYTAA